MNANPCPACRAGLIPWYCTCEDVPEEDDD